MLTDASCGTSKFPSRVSSPPWVVTVGYQLDECVAG